MAQTVPEFEQKAKQAPLPCFGLEFNRQDPRCQACPHQNLCTEAMGQRLDRVSLSKAEFHLVPENYKLAYEQIDFDDPEVANMERTYILCSKTIFRKNPEDTIRDRDAVASAARRNECSIRLYMLAIMAGHRAHSADIMQHANRSKAPPFKSTGLLGKVAQARFETFRDLCAKEYGAFSLSRISALLEYDFDKNSPEQKLLNSEIAAGQCIVDYKMATGGPFFEHLYRQCELSLDPLWLAIEPSYLETVLNPYREKPRGSAIQKDHRHSASLAIQHLKKHRNTAIMVFQAREAVMPKAIATVLRLFGYGADDFLISREPVTNCLALWNWLALAIQHDECLRYVDGKQTRILRS